MSRRVLLRREADPKQKCPHRPDDRRHDPSVVEGEARFG